MHLEFAIAVSLSMLAIATPALAQVSGGMFGATRNETGRGDRLNLEAFVAEAFETEVPPEFSTALPGNELRSGGPSTLLAATADYARDRRSVQLFGSASTYLRHSQRLDRFTPGTQSGQAGIGLRLPKQGNLRMSQSAAYAPSYLYQLFPASAFAPEQPVPANPDYQIVDTESYWYRTNVAATFGSALGTRLTATAEYSTSDFKKQPVERPSLVTYSAGAKLSRAFSRRDALLLGYEYRTGDFGFGGITKTHRITIGAAYSPPLSVTRRAILRVEMSPSIVENTQSAIAGAGVVPRFYPLQGEASVDYPFRLKWRAVASYRRSIDYVPVLTEPMFATGAHASIVGVIGRRVDVSMSGGAASAVSALSRSTQNLTTYTGDARIRYALTRSFAIYSEYLYYFVDLKDQLRVASGLPAVFEQHGVRFGFTVFAQPLRN